MPLQYPLPLGPFLLPWVVLQQVAPGVYAETAQIDAGPYSPPANGVLPVQGFPNAAYVAPDGTVYSWSGPFTEDSSGSLVPNLYYPGGSLSMFWAVVQYHQTQRVDYAIYQTSDYLADDSFRRNWASAYGLPTIGMSSTSQITTTVNGYRTSNFLPGSTQTITLVGYNYSGISANFFTRVHLTGLTDGSTVGESPQSPLYAGQQVSFSAQVVLPGTPGVYNVDAELWEYLQGVWKLVFSDTVRQVAVIPPDIVPTAPPAPAPVLGASPLITLVQWR